MPLKGQSIICISDRDWDFLWTRTQEIMLRFAQDGNRVLYIEALGIRSPGIRDLSRIVGRLKNWLKQRVRGIRQVGKSLYIYSPIILPFQDLRVSNLVNQIILVFSIRRLMKKLAFSQPIIWTYYPTQIVLDLINELGYKLLIYDYIDAFVHNPGGVVKSFPYTEKQLLKNADLVFATSETLYKRARRYNRNTYRISTAVNLEHFCQFNAEEAVPPQDLAGIGSPRIGYFGQIDQRLDFDLLEYLARSHPEWSLVMIGAVKTNISSLKRLRNVYFLGMKPHQDLPRYLTELDVLIIPYLINDFTIPIYPAKIYECFAVGKPLVTTDLPELRPLEGLIRIARGRNQFVRHISQAILERDEGLTQRRREIAINNSWASRYKLITEKIVQRCAEKDITLEH